MPKSGAGGNFPYHPSVFTLNIPNGIRFSGGLAAGLVAFCFAELKSGFHLISDMLDLKTAIKNCDILITGEGALDATSALGKVEDQCRC